MTRQQANREILKILSALVETYPDQRFTQLLFNADVLKCDPRSTGVPEVRNEYHMESEETLERVRKSMILEVK